MKEKEFVRLRLPCSYEEAEQVMINMFHDEVHRDAVRNILLRGLVVGGIGVIASVISWIVDRDTMLFWTFFGVSCFMGILTMSPVIGMLIDAHNAKTGRMFQKIGREETIRSARNYVRNYNKYCEEKREKKRKRAMKRERAAKLRSDKNETRTP